MDYLQSSEIPLLKHSPGNIRATNNSNSAERFLMSMRITRKGGYWNGPDYIL